MTSPFTSPLFTMLGQKYDAVDIYPTVFRSVKPNTSCEFPYLYANHAGIQLALTKKTFLIEAIFLFAQDVEKNEQYQGEIPAGIPFTATREEVRAVLGQPVMGMDASGEGLLAIEYSFDRYENDAHYFRVEYYQTGGIRLITLGIPYSTG
jgi:hypothetical protein